MAYFDFLWTDKTIDHIAQHGISQEDFEDVVCYPEARGVSQLSGFPAAWGTTSDGRFIIAIYEKIDDITVLPVTAYEVTED